MQHRLRIFSYFADINLNQSTMEENKQDLGKNFKDELKIESSELLNKLHELTYFIYSDKFANIKDKTQRLLFLLQHEAMKDYSSILKQRISNINKSNDLDIKIGIGIIKNCLIFGLPVRRKSWDKNLVVFKQRPATISKEIIQKIQSLPDSAKEIILNNADSINYKNQCLICDISTGEANPWFPTIDDMFAEDWEIIL